MKIMDYEVYDGELSNINLEKKIVINTINPHSYIITKKDPLFKQSLQESDILIPDGSGIVLAAKQINKKRIKKIAGADLHSHLLTEMNKVNGKIFYMGASQETLSKIKIKINRDFPNIQVESYSPPYKLEFSEDDNKIIISKINSFNPNILFVGMTAPKQEKWLHQNKEILDFNVASSIGAVFDFYAGTIKRPKQLWINLHLEWFIRFVHEPKRLFKRNFVSSPLFLVEILMFKLNLKK